MAGRSAHEAVRNFVGPLQQAISCVTDAVWSVSHDGYDLSRERPHGLALNKGQPARLQGPKRPHLSAGLEYDVIRTEDPERGPFKVQTRAYRYHVLTDDRTESVLFHWHPDASSTYHRPHLHIGNAELSPTAVLSRKSHLPTGRIAVEHVLMLLLSDFGVVPQRDDADVVLDDCLRRFERWRTWT